jgi:preprotein translocase subunit YajC
MAISKKIGQDSEGFPIFKRDKDNNITDQLDHDFGDILKDFHNFKENSLVESEYRFSIKRSEIDGHLRINPQVYLPNLNKTIKQIESIDGVDGWSVTTLGQITQNIRIFKGPRFKSENIIVETPGPNIEPYYTPSAMLQEKSESVKLVDISRANSNQIRTIEAIRVKLGDIVITRSGTIGRVSYVTKKFDNAIFSDDLIRVKIDNEHIRLYVLSFLQSGAALDQMIRNEYGAVQQHLEPQHIANIIIPVPKKWNEVKAIVNKMREIIDMKEKLEKITPEGEKLTRSMLDKLISMAENNIA